MNRAHRRQAKPRHPPIPATWGEVLERCPFRSLIGIGQPRDANGMMERIAHTFAALGGGTTPIADDLLDEMATSIRARGVVLLISDRADLRDAAKREILARAEFSLSAARVGDGLVKPGSKLYSRLQECLLVNAVHSLCRHHHVTHLSHGYRYGAGTSAAVDFPCPSTGAASSEMRAP